MASAEVALGEHERAFERKATIRKEMDSQPVVFDWYIRMLLESCLTEVRAARCSYNSAGRCSTAAAAIHRSGSPAPK
jgi:hypothetical protein